MSQLLLHVEMPSRSIDHISLMDIIITTQDDVNVCFYCMQPNYNAPNSCGTVSLLLVKVTDFTRMGGANPISIAS